jgi:glycerate kinase
LKKVVLAIDSFKGCLTSQMAEEAAEEGVRTRFPECEVIKIPVSDGGEGMLECFEGVFHAERTKCVTSDPLQRPIITEYAISESNDKSGATIRTAIIESARIIGLGLLKAQERDPGKTTSFGIGTVIIDALNRGCTHFIIGLGGSSTNDAGIGMMQALGYRFIDGLGIRIPTASGSDLGRIRAIDATRADSRLAASTFTIAADVSTPLFGDSGATRVFAAQKGASEHEIARMELGMERYAEVLQKFLNDAGRARTGDHDYTSGVPYLPGSGAAGGIGSAILGYLRGEMNSGISLLLDNSDFDSAVSSADLVITGEGRCDMQTLMGKAPYGILQRVRKGKRKTGAVSYPRTGKQSILSRAKIPVMLLAGEVVTDAIDPLKAAGFTNIIQVTPARMPLREALNPANARANITKTVAELMLLF